jgi:hypothetical protein
MGSDPNFENLGSDPNFENLGSDPNFVERSGLNFIARMNRGLTPWV